MTFNSQVQYIGFQAIWALKQACNYWSEVGLAMIFLTRFQSTIYMGTVLQNLPSLSRLRNQWGVEGRY